ncbi:hypothetical protein ABTK20_20520, partial [Acinetobacter baumannii]
FFAWAKLIVAKQAIATNVVNSFFICGLILEDEYRYCLKESVNYCFKKLLNTCCHTYRTYK